jgi:hypothetical protein
MSINVSIGRLAQLAACIALFVTLGGFSDPAMNQRAWLRLFLIFVAGAVSFSMVDHEVGLMDRTNLRFAYLVGGGVLMVASLVWLRAIV